MRAGTVLYYFDCKIRVSSQSEENRLRLTIDAITGLLPSLVQSLPIIDIAALSLVCTKFAKVIQERVTAHVPYALRVRCEGGQLARTIQPRCLRTSCSDPLRYLPMQVMQALTRLFPARFPPLSMAEGDVCLQRARLTVPQARGAYPAQDGSSSATATCAATGAGRRARDASAHSSYRCAMRASSLRMQSCMQMQCRCTLRL